MVTNIHPDNSANGAPCVGANEEYFGAYIPEGVGPIAYDGYTRAFTAQSEVNIGETYNIKLAVADAGDEALDSAVFLEAGSFQVGGSIGDDITIESGNALCYGETATLDTELPSAAHVWYFEGVEIPNQTTSILNVTEEGNYSADIILSLIHI